jgi:deazaflavin-dependent oxidoreductase (nitroreductase family)
VRRASERGCSYSWWAYAVARKRQRRLCHGTIRPLIPRWPTLADLRYVDPYKPRGRLYRAVCRFSSTKVGAWLSVNVAWKIDPRLLKLTRGRLSTAAPIAAALLETRGARTGRPRRNATLYFHDGDRVTIVASLRGWPRNPAWYYNLRKHPDIIYGGLPFRAEIVEDEAERQRLWDLADRVYPRYADFREEAGRAGRSIPIVQLVPR